MEYIKRKLQERNIGEKIFCNNINNTIEKK